MKKSEAVAMLDLTAEALCTIDIAEIRDKETGETKGIVSHDAIRGMLCALTFCESMLAGSIVVMNPMEAISDLTGAYAHAFLGIKEESDEDADD